eukprot:1438248-Rhodomonas_salina.1
MAVYASTEAASPAPRIRAWPYTPVPHLAYPGRLRQYRTALSKSWEALSVRDTAYRGTPCQYRTPRSMVSHDSTGHSEFTCSIAPSTAADTAAPIEAEASALTSRGIFASGEEEAASAEFCPGAFGGEEEGSAEAGGGRGEWSAEEEEEEGEGTEICMLWPGVSCCGSCTDTMEPSAVFSAMVEPGCAPAGTTN